MRLGRCRPFRVGFEAMLVAVIDGFVGIAAGLDEAGTQDAGELGFEERVEGDAQARWLACHPC